MIETLVSIIIAALLVLSGIAALVGCTGLLRLPTFFSRVHAPTLGNTLGIFAILVATILFASTTEHRLVVHPVLITVFLVITSPVTSILLVRSAIRRKPHEVAAQKEASVNANSPQNASRNTTSDIPEPGSPPSTADQPNPQNGEGPGTQDDLSATPKP